MENKVILISIDGMRPDGLLQCGSDAVDWLRARATYTLDGKTVMPSVTLPCHMSLFYGVVPMRHGILSNTFVPQVHTVTGLFEKIAAMGGISAMFYGWEPMRDVCPPTKCKFSTYVNAYMEESSDTVLTDAALKLIGEKKPDFVYLYQVETDEKGGHDNGWMSAEYLRRIRIAIENARRVCEACGDEYTVIITADHGGHDRMHGTDMPQDTTIPMFFLGADFARGKEVQGLSILDIAPTVAYVMGFAPEKEWEGKALPGV
ncbi:MAG: alkaline phosphatase family protein [Clostridia bacterium]|nr:alkaline phosphatase family protein [Clostridia bacterium]